MHHYHLDQFAHGVSPVHRLDARVKLAALVAYSAILISFDRYAISVLAPLAIAPLVMLRVGGVPAYFALRRIVILCPFILAMCLLSPLYDHSRHFVALGPWQFAVSGGWLTAADIAVKFSLGLLALTAVMATTPFALLLEAMRRLAAPRVLVMALSLLYRYLFVLLEEAGRVRRARDFRGAAAAPAGRRLAAAGGAIGTLFVRTLDRSDRIHTAMCTRGYDGNVHSLSRLKLRCSDAVFLLGAAAYLCVCRWLYPAWIGRS